MKDDRTARLVELCAEQIRVALDEAFREVDALSRSVLETARHADRLLGSKNEHCCAALALRAAVDKAIMQTQFADRLEQRMTNVSSNLMSLARLMRAQGLPIPDSEWCTCLEATRATFTMQQERQMFDAAFAAGLSCTDREPNGSGVRDPVLFDVEVDSEIT